MQSSRLFFSLHSDSRIMVTGAIVSLGLSAATNALSFTHLRLSPFRRHVSPSNFPLFSMPKHASLSVTKHLPGPTNLAAVVDGGAVLHDATATGLVAAAAYALVSTFDTLTQRNIIDQNLSRKLVHILSGLLFMASWPIYSTSTGARYFASLVPFVNCLRLLIYGLSLAKDEGLVKSVTREGNPEELLRGPFYYVLVLIICALVFWRESPVGVISLAMMCGGDGIADIIGRRFGSLKLPYNPQKSWAGSISMFLFGFLTSVGMLYYFSALGYFHLDWTSTMERVALVSLVATVLESLSTTKFVDDNISVPLVSIITAMFLFGY